MAVLNFLSGLDIEIYADRYEELEQIFQSDEYNTEPSEVIPFDPTDYSNNDLLETFPEVA